MDKNLEQKSYDKILTHVANCTEKNKKCKQIMCNLQNNGSVPIFTSFSARITIIYIQINKTTKALVGKILSGAASFFKEEQTVARQNFSSGAPLEEKVGYSRMVRVGNQVFIGGTTSVQPDGTVYGEGSAYEQTKYILEKQVKLLKQAGATAADVVKVDAFIVNMKDCSEICRAYSELFYTAKPLFTAVGTTALNRPSQLVEIELMAVIDP